MRIYGWMRLYDVDCLIIAVAHNEFKALQLKETLKMFREKDGKKQVLIDVKGIYGVMSYKKQALSGGVCSLIPGCETDM